MRHGPAADDSVTGRDEARILTREGRLRVERMAELLVGRGVVPTQLIASPLVRASETAMIVIRVLRAHGHGVPLVVAPELAPGRLTQASAETIFARHHLNAECTCMVGHEPCLSAFVEEATGVSMTRGFDKAMIVAIEGGLAEARLAFVLDPAAHGG